MGLLLIRCFSESLGYAPWVSLSPGGELCFPHLPSMGNTTLSYTFLLSQYHKYTMTANNGWYQYCEPSQNNNNSLLGRPSMGKNGLRIVKEK
jgi:hypothetical protein